MTTQPESARRADTDDRTIGALTTDLTTHLSRLFRAEARLAVAELRKKVTFAKRGGAMLGAAGVFGLLGAATLTATAVLALALVWPAWLAALVVGVAAVLLAGLLALVGRFELHRATPPVPEWTADSLRTDIDVIKGRLRS